MMIIICFINRTKEQKLFYKLYNNYNIIITIINTQKNLLQVRTFTCQEEEQEEEQELRRGGGN